MNKPETYQAVRTKNKKGSDVKLIKKVSPDKTKMLTAKGGASTTIKAVGLECAPLGASAN